MSGPRLRSAAAALLLASLAGAAEAGERDDAAPHLGSCGPVAGAFQLPGTDACLRLSGFVAAGLGWRLPSAGFTALPAASPAVTAGPDLRGSAIGADARLSVDVHIPTAYGPARVYVSVRARNGGLPLAH